MRMNLPPERQGHLSDLSKKTLGELKELLERQEKILARRYDEILLLLTRALEL